MKRWQAIAAILILAVLIVALAGHAKAQDWEEIPSLYAAVITKVGVLVDGLLNHWVIGNAMTSDGASLAEAVAYTARHTVHFFALILTLF